jgi:hypothetical protein
MFRQSLIRHCEPQAKQSSPCPAVDRVVATLLAMTAPLGLPTSSLDRE